MRRQQGTGSGRSPSRQSRATQQRPFDPRHQAEEEDGDGPQSLSHRLRSAPSAGDRRPGAVQLAVGASIQLVRGSDQPGADTA
ncbi:MAG: hypothetical protein ABW196_06240 [Solirubrobacterales bacterium]